jgi:hypothetical protein
MQYEILRIHGGENVYRGLQGCDAVETWGKLPVFLRDVGYNLQDYTMSQARRPKSI